MYEYVDIDVHAPVLNLPEYGPRSQSSVLSRAVIQGSFTNSRRDYPNIFRDLVAELERKLLPYFHFFLVIELREIDDAPAWGYRPLARDRDVFEPILGEQAEPFKLYLIGEGRLDIPKSLEHVVVVQKDLNYTEFYAFMQSMDVVIPAFVNFQCKSPPFFPRTLTFNMHSKWLLSI